MVTLKPAKIVDLSTRTTANTVIQTNPKEKTQAISSTQPTKIPKVPLEIIVPAIVLLAAGAMGYWVMGMLSPPDNIALTTTSTPSATATGKAKSRSVENIEVGWVIKTKEAIKLEGQKPLPPKTFLQVTDKIPNPNNPQEFLVHLQLCPDKQLTPANRSESDNSIAENQPENTRPIELSPSQLKKVSVWPERKPSPCDRLELSPATKTPVSTPLTSPTSTPADNP